METSAEYGQAESVERNSFSEAFLGITDRMASIGASEAGPGFRR